MKKGTKSFGGFIVVTLSAILIIAAIAAAVFYNEVVIPEPETQAFAAGEEYVHGSDIGRRPSGTAGTDYYNVSTPSEFRTAVNNNQNINLTGSFTISSPNIRSMADYSATIYGNGHTITFDLPTITGTNNSTEDYSGSNYYYCGLLVGTLCGKIYDLNVELTGGSFKTGLHTSGGSKLNTFGLVGRLYTNGNNHGTIENVSVTLNSGVGIRLYSWANTVRTGLGLVAGLAEGGAIIRNVTVENNGTLESGYTTNASSASDIVYKDNGNVVPRSASNVVGYFDSWSQTSGTITLDNIIVKGNGQLNGREACNLGTSESGNAINVGTFYNHFIGTFNGAGDESAGFIKWGSATQPTIDTYIEYYNDENNHVAGYGNSYNANITEKLSLSSGGNNGENENLEILFDPATDNYDNSLVLVFKNRTFDSNKLYTYNLTSRSGTIFSYTKSFDNSVVFAGLPIASIWNNLEWGKSSYSRGDGWFTYTGPQQTEYEKLPALTEYEHGYVSEDYVSEATIAINNGAEFESLFKPNGAADVNGKYYLTDDIIIKGFTGKSFSGTLDGNGHTIYIHAARTGLDAENIGGLMGKIDGGTVKNLRVALVNDLNISTSATKKTNTAFGIGMITGWLTGNGLIENCNVVIKEGVTVYGAADNQDCTVAGVAGVMTGRGRVFNTTVQLDGTLKVKRSYPFIAGFVGLCEKPNFESDSVNTIPFEFKNIVFKGNGSFAGIAENTGGENVNLAAVTITPNVTQNVGQWIDMDGVIYDFSEDYWNEAASSNDIPSGYGLISQNFASDNPGGLKPTTINGTKYIDYKNLYRATEYAPVKTPGAGDSGNTAYNIPINNTIEVTVSSAAGGTISDISVTPYFRPGSDGNITLVASGTGVSGFNGVLKEKGATIGEGKDSIPAAAKIGDNDNLVLEMPKADVASASDTSVGLEEAKTVTLTTDAQKSFTYSGDSQARSVYLKYGESSISDYTVTYAAESGSELSDGSPVNAGSYYISVVALTENAGDYYFFDAASNTLSKSYTYASVDENSNKFVINPAVVELAFVSGSMTVTYDAANVENPGVSVSGDTFGLDDLGELTYVWMKADGTTLSANPIDAGSYKVKISAVENQNFTVGGAAAKGNDFTIKAKEVTLSVEEGGNLFAFAQDTGALTNENYEDIRSYSFSVTDFVEADEVNSGYTVSITTAEGVPSFITENTTDGTPGTSYLSAGDYKATVVLSSENYTFGEGNNTFTVTVNENSSANKWLTEPESIISDMTYYSEPDIPTDDELPVPRFGNATVAYKNAENSEVTLSKTLDVGTYSAVVTVSDSDSDSPSFNSLEKSYSFKVNPLALTSVTLTGSNTTYDTAAYEESNISIALRADNAEYNSDEDIENLLGTVTWEYQANESDEWSDVLPTKAAKYTFRIKSYTNSSNVALPSDYSSGTFTISPKTINFTAALAKNAKLVYGTEPEDKTALVSVTPTVEDVYKEDFTEEYWSYEVALLLADGGDYAVDTPAKTEVTLTVTVTINDKNYSLGTVSGSETLTLEVQKATIGDITIATEFTTEREEEDGSVTPGFVYGAVTAPLTFNGIPKDVDPTIVYTKGGAGIDEFTGAAEAGDYTVKVTISDKNYNEKEVSFDFFIDKAEQSVNVTISGWTYKGTENAPVIEGIKEGVTPNVRYSGTTNAGEKYDSATAPEDAGTYTVTVSWGETTNYTAGSVESAKFTIKRAAGKADITITYSVDGGTGATYIPGETMLYYNGSAYTFKVAVEYFEKDGGTLTTEINDNPGDNLTTANAGTYTVTATVSESSNYLMASSETSIVINKAVISGVSVGTSSFVFGADGGLTTDNANDGTTYGTASVDFVEGCGSGSPVFTYALNYGTKYETSNDGVSYINKGTYALTFGLNEESATNFKFDEKFVEGGCSAIIKVDTGSNEFTNKKESTGWIYGLTSNTSSATSKFGNVVIKTVDKDGNEVKISNALNAGTYTDIFTVSPSKYGNYGEISYKYTFVVEKHDLNITKLTISNNGVELEPTTDGFTVTYAPDMVLSATVNVSSGENLSASLDSLIGEKGSYTYSFEYSAEDSDEWDDGFPQRAGIYTVRFKGMKLEEGKDINNFAFVYEGNETELTTKLTINKATVSASAELNGDIVYGMTLEEVRELVQINYTDTALDYEVDIAVKVGDTNYTGAVNAGTAVSITVKITVDDPNYTATVSGDTEYTLTVQKRAVTIAVDETATMLHANYNQFDPTPFYGHIRIDGLQNDDAKENVFNIALPVVSVTPTTDTYEVNVSLNTDFAGYDNYDFGDKTEWVISLTLSAREFTFTVQMKGSFVYGKEIDGMELVIVQPEGEEEIPSSVLHQPMTFRYIGVDGTEYDSDIAPVNVGKYTLTVTITGTADYHSEPATSNVFEITPAPLTMTIDAAAGGLSTTYDPDTEITDFMAEFAGYFKVAFPADGAYTDEFGDIFSLSATKDNDGSVESIKNAGIYKITAKLKNDNYDWATGATSPEFTYTINKAIVEGFEVEIEKWTYGEPGSVPKFSGLIDDMTTGEGYEVTYRYSGEDNSGKVYNSSSEQPTDAGNYTVTATYPGNANYESATATCDFIIDKADLDEFAVSAPDNLTYTGQPLSDEIPVVEGTRGGYNVVYKNSDGKEIERSAIIAAGTYTAIVTALGTANYNEAEKQCRIIIAPARVSVTVSSSNEISFGVLKTDQVNGVYDTDGLKGYDFGVNITSQTSLSELADPLYYTYVIVSSLGGEVAGEEGFINVGSYKVVIDLSSDNYIFTDTDEHTTDFAFEILTVENTITGDFRKDWIYGNDPSGVTADAKYGSVVIKTVDKDENEVVVSNALYAGTYTDIFTVPASEYGNYDEITVKEEFTISPRPLSWNWSHEIGNEIVFGTTSEELEGKVSTEIIGWFNEDSEYASVAFTFAVDGAAYDELVNAGSKVTLTLSFEWAEGAPEKLKGSYSVTDPESYVKSFEVISKSVTLTKEDFNEVYGSAYDPSTPLADYFANRFFYEDTAIGEAFDEYTVCEYSINGDGKAEDRLNAGTYSVTVSVTGNYSAEAELTYTVDKKTISLSDEASVTEEYGVLTPGNLTSVIDPAKLFEGLEFEDKFSEGDFTTSTSDYSENVEDGFLTVGEYFVYVDLTDKAVNYTAPEEGLGSVVIYVTKAGNYIDSYYPDDWTYLDNLTEYLPEIPGAKFGKVQSAFFAPDGTEMDLNDFSAETPAGTYSYEFTVSGTDNYASATLKGKFSVKVRNVFVTLNAPDTIFDGAAYDQLTYTLSDDKVTEYVGEITFGYSSGGSSYTEGFPVNAGSYIIKLLKYSDSENINLLSEPVSVVISPAPMNFTVTGAAYASVEYGTDPDEIDLDALIASVVPDSDIGSFTYTVNLLTAKGREYTDSTYAGTVLYACVEITVTNGNFYAVVPEEVEDFPAVNVVRKAHDISLEVDDEIVTDGNEITVAEGIDVNLIDAIASYMSKNGVKYYDYVVTVDGESYNRDMVWTPGEHEVIVRLSGNHEGEASFTVMVEESLEPAKEPFVPATKVGEVLESINFTWASAVSIGFGVAVAVLIILFFGLRRSKKK